MPKEDISVHRYKFADWTPSPIKCIAVDTFSGLVAVGREDGEIEITNPGELWYIQARVSGKEGFGLKGLAFSPLKSDAGRLFGISLCGFVFEVDFASLTIKNVRDSYGGGVWSIASNPRGPTMALGCEDKTIKFFSYANSSSLEYEKSFPSTGSRVLCVAFNPTLPQVLAGCADGTIRCYDENTGSSMFRLTGDIMKGMKISTCIWSLMVLADESSTIVSGDSHGKLQFWNGKSGDLLSSIHQHSAAIQCIASSDDQNTIFASGVDSRVICVQRLSKAHKASDDSKTATQEAAVNLPSSDRWVFTSAHRPHSHDVFALAVASTNNSSVGSSSSSKLHNLQSSRQNTITASHPSNTEGRNSVLISGGLDCKLCLYSTSDFAGCRPNWILPIPCTGVASASLGADTCNIVSIKHRTHVDLWGLHMNKDSSDVSKSPCENTCRIQLRSPKEEGKEAGMLGRDHIHSVVISPNGLFIAVTGGTLHSTSSSFRLFQIVQESDKAGTVDATQVRRIQLDEKVEQATHAEYVSCQTVAFSANSSSLAVVTTAASGSLGTSSVVSVLLLDISAVASGEDRDAKVTLHHTLKHSKIISKALKGVNDSISGLEASLGNSIKSMSFSADDRWLAVATSSRRLYVYEIDRSALHWIVPYFTSPITCVAFHPTSPNSLLTSTTSSATPFLIFDVQKKDLSVWSQENTDIIPDWKSTIKVQNYGPIQNITFDPSCDSAFMLFGQGFSIYVDLNLPILTTLPAASSENSEGDAGEDRCQYVHKGQLSVLARDSDLNSKGNNEFSRQLTGKKRRKHDRDAEAMTTDNDVESVPYCRNFSVIKAYRSLVFAALLGEKEMVVVENPWVRILENLPATLSRKRYGT